MQKDIIGIILKDRDYGESSKILDVLTKEYGIIGVISKGSKKIKSNLSGVSSKLAYGTFHIYYKEGKLSTLTNADIINPFINIKSNIKTKLILRNNKIPKTKANNNKGKYSINKIPPNFINKSTTDFIILD